jgi:hypothetical protein
VVAHSSPEVVDVVYGFSCTDFWEWAIPGRPVSGTRPGRSGRRAASHRYVTATTAYGKKSTIPILTITVKSLEGFDDADR